MDNNYFTFFEQSQTSIKRYTDETKAKEALKTFQTNPTPNN